MTAKAARPLALVTGGWRRIGAAIARQLAGLGYDLGLHAHYPEAFSTILRDDLAVLGALVVPLAGDLSDPACPAALVATLTQAAGRAPVLLVNCASLFRDDGPTDFTAAGFDLHMAVNARAPLLLTQAMAAALPAGVTGSVVHILDQRVRNPVPDQISYTLSKQALAASVVTMARALAPRLRVNAVAPGLTLPTPDYTAEQWQQLAAMMPLAHLARPEDIAEAVGYLAGASAVTGQTLFVDAGAHLEAYPRDFVYMGQ